MANDLNGGSRFTKAVERWRDRRAANRQRRQQTYEAAKRKRERERLFTPSEATSTLYHERPDPIELRRCSLAYAACYFAVADAQAARAELRRLSFYSDDDELILAQAIRGLVELGEKLDRIDAALLASSTGEIESIVRQHYWMGDQMNETMVGNPELVQWGLERFAATRSGADGAWFKRVIAKRVEVASALEQGRKNMKSIREKAVWMAARQQGVVDDDALEFTDPTLARSDILEAASLIDALAEGVGEVYIAPRY